MLMPARRPPRYWPPLSRRERLAIAIIVLVLVLASFPLLIDVLPPLLAHTSGLGPKARSTEMSRIRTAELAMVGGMVAVFGAFYTHRNFRLNHQGQITERFTRAVDQLGSDKTEIRVGGIYALQRIARESPIDHAPIMEILTGFLRDHARWARSSAIRPEQHGHAASARGVRADVQAALSVIAHRTVDYDGARPLDLAGVNLQRADFRDASLIGATLSSSNLADADLSDTDLTGAGLAGSRLIGANLRRTALTNADLSGADLSRCDLTQAILAGPPIIVTAYEPSYQTPGLGGAVLRRQYRAETIRRRHQGLSLRRATLVEADLTDVDLSGTDLTSADLRRAKLVGAILCDAKLTGAKLAGATVDGADLTGAELADIDVPVTSLRGAILDAKD